jgi:hypothetical protein
MNVCERWNLQWKKFWKIKRLESLYVLPAVCVDFFDGLSFIDGMITGYDDDYGNASSYDCTLFFNDKTFIFRVDLACNDYSISERILRFNETKIVHQFFMEFNIVSFFDELDLERIANKVESLKCSHKGLRISDVIQDGMGIFYVLENGEKIRMYDIQN